MGLVGATSDGTTGPARRQVHVEPGNGETMETLRRPFPRVRPGPFFHHPGVQPLAQQPQNPPVSDPPFHELHQAVPVDRIKERPNVRVHDPIDFPPFDPEASASSASCAFRPGGTRRARETPPRKSAPGARPATAFWRILSSSAATPSGRVLPSGLTRRTGGARYAPRCTRRCRSSSRSSSFAPYSSHRTPSIPAQHPSSVRGRRGAGPPRDMVQQRGQSLLGVSRSGHPTLTLLRRVLCSPNSWISLHRLRRGTPLCSPASSLLWMKLLRRPS